MRLQQTGGPGTAEAAKAVPAGKENVAAGGGEDEDEDVDEDEDDDDDDDEEDDWVNFRFRA